MTIATGEVANADDVIVGYGCPLSQSAYEQVKSDSTNWTNTNYLGADIFSDSNGAKNTVDTGTTTCVYNDASDFYAINFTDEASGDTTHDPDGISDPENAFDDNDTTYAEDTTNGSEHLGKTFASKYVSYVKIKATNTITAGSDHVTGIYLETYNGSSWDAAATLATGTTSASYDLSYFLDSTVEGIRVRMLSTANPSDPVYSKKWYTIEYGDFDASGTVETNSIISDIVPDSIVVHGKTVLPANTTITVDVSDDGGSTFGITAKSLNTAIDTTSFSTGNLALKFNLASTDTSATPSLYGYGIVITDV